MHYAECCPNKALKSIVNNDFNDYESCRIVLRPAESRYNILLFCLTSFASEIRRLNLTIFLP